MKSAMLISAMLVAASALAGSTELTVYNGGFALVKDVRSLELERGRQEVTVENVAQMIDPTSVAIRNLTNPNGFTVFEQNYRYDLISVQAILAKVVGGTVFLNRTLPNGQKERIEATLMSAPTTVVGTAEGGNQMTYNGMVLRTNDGRILLNPSGEVEVASIPKDLISRPSLVWDLEARTAGKQDIELSYLTNGISWTASYVFSLDQAGTGGDLRGWVTLNNQSGATYEDAKLKLLAGDVRRVQEATKMMMPRRAGGSGAADAAGFAEESFADYHLYTLQRPATVRQNEIKQVSLLEGIGVTANRSLVLNVGDGGWQRPESDGYDTRENLKPEIRLAFLNEAKNKLGMPLPAGKIKVYQRDSSGSPQLIGEDQIGHTPKDERIQLTLGTAFDVVGTFKRTNYEAIRSGNTVRGARETFSVQLRNRKDSPERVTVIDRRWGEWKVSRSDLATTKSDAATLQFVVDLRANETKTVTYTVETLW